jgi:hypothetical protein
LVVVFCSDTRFGAVAQAIKDLDAAKASLERRAHGATFDTATNSLHLTPLFDHKFSNC